MQRADRQTKAQEKRYQAKQLTEEREEAKFEKLRMRRESRRQRLEETDEIRRKRAKSNVIQRILSDD